MEEPNIVSFVAWSIITAIIMGITGFSYQAYLRRNKNETTSS
ncbi:MAG: hypothetical protein OEQ12_04180 [Nitrosopumilus sp.]|nr:hypothetical protein [Nitrosopumilus sp.]